MERDYKELKGCEICNKPFTLTRIRHKCKRCKLIICTDCGKAKSIIVGYKKAPKVPHRICNYCRDDVTAQQDVKNRYGTSWAHLSQLGQQWLSACNVLQELDLKFDFRRYLEDSYQITDLAPVFAELSDELSQGRADRESYNLSLTEFMFYSQQGKDRETVRRNVENVLRAFYTRYAEQGYCSLLISIVTFLLCFTDEESAFILLCYLNEKIVPDRFWDLHSSPIPFIGLLREKYILKHAVRRVFNTGADNLRPFEIVFKKVANLLVGGLMVDVVNFGTQIHVWSEMFTQRSFRPFENAVVRVLKHSANFFVNFYHLTLYNYRVYTCRHIHSSTITNEAAQLLEEEKTNLAIAFDETIIEKYATSHRVLNHTLQRLKTLTTAEADIILSRIRLLIQSARVEKRDDSTFAELDLNQFINAFRQVDSLNDLTESDLTDIFEHLDIYKKGLVSSRVVAGLVILLISENLETKLNDIFTLFAAENQKHISPKEIPKIIDFLSEILPVLNEADPTYVHFQVHLYEMTETLRKKAKKMEKVTANDFRTIIGKYPVFQVVTGEKRMFRRGESLLADYTETSFQDASPGVQNGEFPEQQIIVVDEKVDEKDSDEELQEEEIKIAEAEAQEIEQEQQHHHHRESTVEGTEPENSEFLNASAIKAQIHPVAKKQERGQLEKDNSCSLCNMF